MSLKDLVAGDLGVEFDDFLRLLDVRVPETYGPTGDSALDA